MGESKGSQIKFSEASTIILNHRRLLEEEGREVEKEAIDTIVTELWKHVGDRGPDGFAERMAEIAFEFLRKSNAVIPVQFRDNMEASAVFIGHMMAAMIVHGERLGISPTKAMWLIETLFVSMTSEAHKNYKEIVESKIRSN